MFLFWQTCGNSDRSDMSQKFSSVQDAIRMGFIIGRADTYLSYRGCIIFGHDTSGRGLKGLSYALRVEVPDEYTSNYLGVLSDKLFGRTSEILIVGSSGPSRAVNNWQASRIGTADSGRPVPMFEPQIFDEAVNEARRWADRWFRAHPDAVAQANERKRAERIATNAALDY